MDLGLNGKIAVVTAASRGLGRAVAEALEVAPLNITANILAPGLKSIPGGGFLPGWLGPLSETNRPR